MGWSLYQYLLVQQLFASFFPGEGIYFGVSRFCRLRRTSKCRHFQTTTHAYLVIVLAGVISASTSKILIDGESMFTNNSAGTAGGENGRVTFVSLTMYLDILQQC